MSEIRPYKGKRIDTLEWIEGDCLIKNDTKGNEIGRYILLRNAELFDIFEVIASSVVQYTGVSAAKSYRGTKPEDLRIWEGDILGTEQRGTIEKLYVESDNGFYCARTVDNDIYAGLYLLLNHDTRKWNIIGNLTDNPELFKV